MIIWKLSNPKMNNPSREGLEGMEDVRSIESFLKLLINAGVCDEDDIIEGYRAYINDIKEEIDAEI